LTGFLENNSNFVRFFVFMKCYAHILVH